MTDIRRDDTGRFREPDDDADLSVVGSGWLGFAGLLILLLGVMNALEGIVALVNDKYRAFIGGSLYVFDLAWWGWIHLLLGLLLAAVGIGVLAGKQWARAVGVGLAAAAGIVQMLYLTSAPLWSLINMGLCVLIIYALVVPPRNAVGN